jgi:hypothetical protein
MPKQLKGDSWELRCHIGERHYRLLEEIAESGWYGNSVGDVVRHILVDNLRGYAEKCTQTGDQAAALTTSNKKRANR